MKKGLTILIVALLAGVVAFMLTRTHQRAVQSEVLLDSLPELAWLRTELKLSDEQFGKASELHKAYRPTCAEMCRNISEAHARLSTLAQGGSGMTPELNAAIQNHARVHAECQAKMLEHLYQTAALLDERQAKRFLQATIPHALDSSITGAKSSCH